MIRFRRQSKVSRTRRTADESKPACAPFTRFVPLTQLLADDAKCAQYADILEQQDLLDDGLATSMSLADWQVVLPQAPWGCLAAFAWRW